MELNKNVLLVFLSIILLTSSLYIGLVIGLNLLALGVVLLSVILISLGLFTLFWMLFAWENPTEAEKHQSPKVLLSPHFTFTALIPARHEARVIADTIKAVDAIHYPTDKKEIIILCRSDDTETITVATHTIAKLKNHNIRLETFNDYPINKPHALNVGLRLARGHIVTIFDAEDEPHPYIYGVLNTVFLQQKCDVVQSGVQLMNFRSTWFAALNCMEYYFWFKSGLPFFSSIGGTTPLGGNTVFFKKASLLKIGGWDEKCLTEDADIGFRLATAGAKTHIIYDEKHTTQEEVPANTMSFMKQRTRWNQGFLQIFSKNIWVNLPTTKQKLTALYILLSPVLQAILILYIPFAAWLSLEQKLPILVTIISFLPLLLLGLMIVTINIGLYEFTKAYRFKFSWLMPFVILFTFFPYQIVLCLSSLRALIRYMIGSNAWEKTSHFNTHRLGLNIQ